MSRFCLARAVFGVCVVVPAHNGAIAEVQQNRPALIKVDPKIKAGDVQVRVREKQTTASVPLEESGSSAADSAHLSGGTLQELATIDPETAKKLARALAERQIWSLSHERPSDEMALRVAQAEAEYDIWQNSYLRHIYQNQDRDTTIIFWVANLLVLCGIGFATLQFRTTLKTQQDKRALQEKEGATATMPRAGKEADGGASRSDLAVTSITLSADGFSIKSSFLGVIILAISMLFYFGYLKYVYPISIATPADIGVSTGTTGSR